MKPKTLKQLKDKCPYHDDLMAVAYETRGMVEAGLLLRGIDPKKAVKPNPGRANANYIKFKLSGEKADRFVRWFISTLITTGIVVGVLEAIRFIIGG